VTAQPISEFSSQTTSPGTVSVTLGGVGRNMAEASHRILASQGLSSDVVLLAPMGDDPFGRLLIKETQELGMRTDGLLISPQKTAVCNLVLDNVGSLIGGVADMDITKSFEGKTASGNE